MHISGPYNNGVPQMGGAPYQQDYEELFNRRERLLKWLPLVLTGVAGVVAGILGQGALDFPKETFGGIAALLLFTLSVYRPEFGFALLAFTLTPFVPTAFKTEWFYVSPAIPLLVMIVLVAMLQIAFHTKKVILPSARTIWPLIGLLVWAIISGLLAQFGWPSYVPRVVRDNPIIVEELVGIVVYGLPLLIAFAAGITLTNKENWIRYTFYVFMAAGFAAALVVIVQYRSIGANVEAFRYESPTIGWMPLTALAQILALGAIIGYAHVLYSKTWRWRLFYGFVMSVCLLSLFISLQNSWWTETGLAFVVMSALFSRRYFVKCLIAVAILLVLISPIIPTLILMVEEKIAVDTLRFTIWGDMLRVWSQRPFTGVGAGNVWAYDGVLSELPIGLRNIEKSGLGVAHNGYLQTLAELGPLGSFFQLSILVVVIVAARRLHRHAQQTGNRIDLLLGIIGLGLVCGAMVGDLTSSYFFLPPRQANHMSSLTQALTGWVIYAMVLQRDQVRRLYEKARQGIPPGERRRLAARRSVSEENEIYERAEG